MKKNLLVDIVSIICLILFSWRNALVISHIIIIVAILSILSILAFQITIKRGNFANLLIQNILTIYIIIFCSISAMYSVDRTATLTQVLYLILTTYFSLMLAIIYSKENFFDIFSKYILITIFISIISFVINPNNTFTIIGGEIGGFQGIYIHKNILARNMLIGAIICNYYSENYGKKIYRYISLLCYLLILFSKSSTSIFILIFYFIFKILNKSKKDKIIVNITMLYSFIVSIIIYFNEYIINSKFAELFTKITGKTIQFTGRINIWNTLLVGWRESPIFGKGYGALWSNSDYIDYIKSKAGLIVYSTSGSHNGYFDILGGIGLIGIILVLIFVYKTYRKNIKKNSLIVLIIPIIIMINFFENYLLGMNTFWIILVYFFNRTD